MTIHRILLIQGDARKIALPDESVQCVATSPPYFGLRDYGTAEWVGGDPECDHVVGEIRTGLGMAALGEKYRGGGKKVSEPKPMTAKGTCPKCGAVRKDTQIGLENSLAEYLESMCLVFDEAWRVLRPDGTVWLNLGDSMSSGVGSNINNFLTMLIKESIIFNGSASTLTITPKRNGVLKHNQLSPDDELVCLFGVQRISIKQGNNYLRQILDWFAPIANCRISSNIITSINQANSEIVLNSCDGISIVVTNHDLDTDTPFAIPTLALPAINSQASLPVEKTREPISEGVVYIEPVGDPVPFNSAEERFPKIDFINNTVSFADAFLSSAKSFGDFSVAKSGHEHLSLSLMDGAVELTISGVGHLFFSNVHGSLMRYTELYHQAEQMTNETQAKQELGVPELLKRALMRRGWICRSTIIWSKPNPMPESVTDRPTRSHEYIFLLSKSKTYFYDADAIRENKAPTTTGDNRTNENGHRRDRQFPGGPSVGGTNLGGPTGGRNKRTVWTVTTKAYKGSHFATFPPDLIEPCILAGTSEKGQCPECDAPWERVVEVSGGAIGKSWHDHSDDLTTGHNQGENRVASAGWESGDYQRTEKGWRPTCDCCQICDHYNRLHGDTPCPNPYDPVPQIVLDPFGGSGTTAMVANKHGRIGISNELSVEYVYQAQKRTGLKELREWTQGKQATQPNITDLPLFSYDGETTA